MGIDNIKLRAKAGIEVNIKLLENKDLTELTDYYLVSNLESDIKKANTVLGYNNNEIKIRYGADIERIAHSYIIKELNKLNIDNKT